jgi:hypothetical protein
VGLERSPLSLVSTLEEVLGRKGSGSGLQSRGYLEHVGATTFHKPVSLYGSPVQRGARDILFWRPP